MKIVIDIDEDVYKRTVFYREFKDLNDCVTTIKALENGTPLPEHHGRLIDADALTEKAPEIQEYLDVLAPTIIEAESEE